MQFSTTDLIAYPIERVFKAHRDHLSEVAEYLPSVSSIQVESRQTDGDVVRLVNIWTAERTEVPRLLRPFVKPEMLKWIDRASWFSGERICRWNIELGFLKDAIIVDGTNNMQPAGDDKTRVTIAGNIAVDATKLPGVPKFMSKKVGSAVESFVVKMITPNLKKTNEGVAAFIAASSEHTAGRDSTQASSAASDAL